MTRKRAITIGVSIGILGTITAIFGLVSVPLKVASYPFRLPAVGLGMIFPDIQYLPGFMAILIIFILNIAIWGVIGWGLHALLKRKGPPPLQ